MKISLAWLYDHLTIDNQALSVEKLVEKFNETTAEIENVRKIEIALNDFALSRVTSLQEESISVEIPELKISRTLPKRADATANLWFLVKSNQGRDFSWATVEDFGAQKNTLLPSLDVSNEQEQEQGAWRSSIEATDYILEIDNKSITHRPDLWGHRGIAREVAALFNLSLKSLDALCTPIACQNSTPSLQIVIENPELCKRFAALSLTTISSKPSSLWMASRLCRVDMRPSQFFVDVTNYVMADLGQPMHAFDADALHAKRLYVRQAHQGERLTLLDNTQAILTSEDIVIATTDTIVSLAGVMGGKESEISSKTTSMILEAACFDKERVRRTALRHKKRTESSARFEKSLDQNAIPDALGRALFLMRQQNILLPQNIDALSVGVPYTPSVITLEHAYIEKKLGSAVASKKVIEILQKLDFSVSLNGQRYTITVPSFRATGDIAIPEDIVEEVGRFLGYTTITPQLFPFALHASNTSEIDLIRQAKHLLAYGCDMQELYLYPFYNEKFLHQLGFSPTDAIAIQNPVSEQWKELATSLIPHLIWAVAENSQDHDILRFFELACTWRINKIPGELFPDEQKHLAGILFSKHKKIDFYEAKDIIERLCALGHITLKWQKADKPPYPWCAPSTTALLSLDDNTAIGYAGLVEETMLRRATEGHAFVFEINSAKLFAKKSSKSYSFSALSKFPDIRRDISMFVPLEVTLERVVQVGYSVDPRIHAISLIDIFEKEEWGQRRALTIHCVIRDMNRTLTKEEADQIIHTMQKALGSIGATIR